MKHRYLAATISSFALFGLVPSAFAADPAPSIAAAASSPAKSCTSLTGAARQECDRVAAEMKKSVEKSEGPDDAKAVGMHSSPVMIDDKEKVINDANRKGKDPRKAVEKIEARDQPPAK
ncbi:MAG: hypothetical protein ABW106_02955 [Steroidobacteraceae bacterium]